MMIPIDYIYGSRADGSEVEIFEILIITKYPENAILHSYQEESFCFQYPPLHTLYDNVLKEKEVK